MPPLRGQELARGILAHLCKEEVGLQSSEAEVFGVQLLESVSLLSTPSSEPGNLCATDGEEVPFSSRLGPALVQMVSEITP